MCVYYIEFGCTTQDILVTSYLSSTLFILNSTFLPEKEGTIMDISVFLARSLGLYFIIVGIAMFMRPANFKLLMQEMVDNAPLAILGGILALVMGILLVVSHNTWHVDWTLMITVLGWMALIKGIMLTVFTQKTTVWYEKLLGIPSVFTFSAIICLTLGLFLIYHGYILK